MTAGERKLLFRWRTAIAESGLRPTARLVGLTLSLHMNEQGDSCYPSLVTLAEETGLHKETVVEGLRALQTAELLRCRTGGGLAPSPAPGVRVGNPNRYTAVIPTKGSAHPTAVEGVGSGPGKGRIAPAKGSAHPTGGRTARGRTSEDEIPPPPARGGSSPVLSDVEARHFAAYWAAYPLHVKRRNAERAFAKALRRGADPEAIVQGAARYRDDPNRDPSFTAHPTSWLDGDRWEDDPLPPRAEPPARPPRLADRMHLAAMAMDEGDGNQVASGRRARPRDENPNGQRAGLPDPDAAAWERILPDIVETCHTSQLLAEQAVDSMRRAGIPPALALEDAPRFLTGLRR